MKMHGGAMGLALSVVVACAVTASAEAQQCFDDVGGYVHDWSVSEMLVSVTYDSSGYACVANCSRTCSFTDSRKRSNLYLWGCWNWNPQNGSWCGIGLGWMGWYQDRFEISIPFTFNHATNGTVVISCITQAPMISSVLYNETLDGWTVDRGVVATPEGATSPNRYIRAGEHVTITRGFGTGTNKSFSWGPCPDWNANGLCDSYESIAGNFGDFDASGDVGASDLATMLSAWGSSGGSDGVIDLDNDGIVGASDLGILLSRWGLGA
jgi:hypothetical protein